MPSSEQQLASLERQADLIDSLSSRITERARRGENVEISENFFQQEKRLYRRMLADAPLHVLEAHTATRVEA